MLTTGDALVLQCFGFWSLLEKVWKGYIMSIYILKFLINRGLAIGGVRGMSHNKALLPEEMKGTPAT